MSRTRVKNPERNFPYKIVYGDPYPDTLYDRYINIKSESITDNNNGVNRPESGVVHSKATHFPHPLPVNYYYGGYIEGDVAASHASILREYFDSQVKTECARVIENIKYKFYNDQASLVERGETLNFMNELRELPSMFKVLSKYSYLDWEFGWSPFLRDLTTLLSKTSSTIASAKAKIASLDKGQPLSVTKNIATSFFHEDAGLAVGFPIACEYIGRAEIRLRGSYRIVYPNLEDPHNLERLRKDIEGYNADPATLWEAVPFSWFVDWFLPIGDSLKALSGTNLNPAMYMRGTISVKCTGTYELYSRHDKGDNSAVRYDTSYGGGTHSYYHRETLADDLDSMFFRPPVFRLPVPDLRKAGIMNDIFGKGSSLVDADKLRHQTRKDRRRINNRLKRGRKAPIG